MLFRRDVGTYLIVSIVALLIWVWAASETRERRTINYGRVVFAAGDPASWVIKPTQQAVTITIEGSKLALEKAEAEFRRTLTLTVSASPGRQTVDIAQAISSLQEIQETGARILGTDPTSMELDVDQIAQVRARVRATLPGVQTADEILIDPAEVNVNLPSLIKGRLPDPSLTVEAFIEKAELERLEPGIRHTREAKIRLPDTLASLGDVSVAPTKVQVSFTIRSRTRDLTLETVRVQLAGPPEDADDYIVEIEPKQLRGVTISADEDLIKKIRSNEATIVAVLHLTSREKENRIESKPATYFMALTPDGKGGTIGTPVQAKAADGAALPVIRLVIKDRAG